MIQNAKDIKLGDKQVIEICLGNELVWRLGGANREYTGIIYTNNSFRNTLSQDKNKRYIKKVDIVDKGQNVYDIDIYTQPYIMNNGMKIYIEDMKMKDGWDWVSYKGQKLLEAKFSFKNVKFYPNSDTAELTNVRYTAIHIVTAITNKNNTSYSRSDKLKDNMLILAIGNKK